MTFCHTSSALPRFEVPKFHSTNELHLRENRSQNGIAFYHFAKWDILSHLPDSPKFRSFAFPKAQVAWGLGFMAPGLREVPKSIDV